MGLEECDPPNDPLCTPECTLNKTSTEYKTTQTLDSMSIASIALQGITALFSSIASVTSLMSINPSFLLLSQSSQC